MTTDKKRKLLLSLAIIFTILCVATVVLGHAFGVSSDSNRALKAYKNNTNGIVYTGENYVVSTEDNRLVWVNANGDVTFEADLEDRASIIKASGDNVYVAYSSTRKIDSFNNGNLVKSYPLKAPIVSFDVSADSGKLVASISQDAFNNYLQIFNLSSGASTNAKTATRVDACAISGGTVYYAEKNGKIYTAGGKNIGEVSATPSDIIVVGGDVYVSTLSDTIECVNDKSKNIDVGSAVIDLDVSGEKIYALERAGKLSVFDSETSKKIHRISVMSEPTKLYVNGDSVIVFQSLKKQFDSMSASDVATRSLGAPILIVGYSLLVISLVCLALAIVFFVCLTLLPVTSRIKKFFHAIKKHKNSYIIILPTFILLIIFNYIPVVWSFNLAFSDYMPGLYNRFVGLANFKAMFTNALFWSGMGNMLIFLVTDIFKAIVFPIIYAEIIFTITRKRFQYWIRVLMYIPGIIPGVAGLYIWSSGILGEGGLINGILNTIGLSNLATDWLGNPSTAMGALVFIGFPYIGSYILFFGALMSVPTSLFEAAEMDGCNYIKRVLIIDIPMIFAQIKYIIIVMFIGSIQDFGRVYLITKGGPGSATYIPALELYYNVSLYKNYGVASAMGLFLFVLVFGATLIMMRSQLKNEKKVKEIV